jgi:hypothetical protein
MPMHGEAISVQPPESILGLVARFDRDRDSCLAGGTMKEERTCRTNEIPLYELYGLTEEEIRTVEGGEK